MLDTIIIVTIQIVVSALMAGSSISKCPYSRLAFAPSGRSVRSLLVPALSNKFINGYQDDYTVHHIGQGTVSRPALIGQTREFGKMTASSSIDDVSPRSLRVAARVIPGPVARGF